VRVNFNYLISEPVFEFILEAVELRSEGSLISAELVTKAKNLGFTVQQIGLDYFPRTRGRSTLSSVGVILKMLRELVSLYPEMRHPRKQGLKRASGTARTEDGPSGFPVD